MVSETSLSLSQSLSICLWQPLMPPATPAADDHPLTVCLRIRRQDGPDAPAYWQQFELPTRPGDSVVALMRALRERPLTSDGRQVGPAAFEHNCMEEVCGACAMRINGRPRPSCSALIGQFDADPAGRVEVTLEPLPKFPAMRDLMVDRAALFAHLGRVRVWIETDGPWDLPAPAPRIPPRPWAADYLYSRCMH